MRVVTIKEILGDAPIFERISSTPDLLESGSHGVSKLSRKSKEGGRVFRTRYRVVFGFSLLTICAPTTCKIVVARASEVVMASHATKYRWCSNRWTISGWWKMWRPADVFPIPPDPTSAMRQAVSWTKNRTIFSTISSRPKKISGATGCDGRWLILLCIC